MKTTGIIAILLLATHLAFGFGEINGRVTEAATGEPVVGAYVMVEVDSNNIMYQAVTDINGFYSIKPVATGTYDIRVSSLTFSQQLMEGITISEGQIRQLNFQLSVNEIRGIVIIAYPDMVQSGYPGTISMIPAKELERSAAAPIDFIPAVTAGAFQEDYGSPIQFRGARPDGTLYFVDGVKVTGDPGIIRNSVQDILVYTGGIPARYGDATGGIIVVTTKSYTKVR